MNSHENIKEAQKALETIAAFANEEIMWSERSMLYLSGIVKARKQLNKLKNWASQSPSGPVPEGTQRWVLEHIDKALESLTFL